MSRADRLYQLLAGIIKTDPHNTLKIRQQTTREATVSECPQLEKNTGDRPGFAAVAGPLGNDLGAASRDPVSAGTDLLIASMPPLGACSWWTAVDNIAPDA